MLRTNSQRILRDFSAKPSPALRPSSFIGVLCLLLLAAQSDVHAGPTDDQEDAKKKQRAASMERMREQIETIKVFQLSDGKRIEAKLEPHPIMRYDDQPRFFYDATLWLWTISGRPVAIGKIEDHRPPGKGDLWINAVFSFAPEPIQVEGGSRVRWTSKKSDAEFKPIPNGPAPADKSVTRLLQMKTLSRRFSGWNKHRGDLQQMRLLPRPVYRYSQPESGIQDAAVFALTSNGTNPTGMFIFEARKKTETSDAKWHFAVVGMSADALAVRLDNKEVWEKPLHQGSGLTLDTYMWYYTRQQRFPR